MKCPCGKGELPPLSQKVKVGDEVLVTATLVEDNPPRPDVCIGKMREIVAILPKEEKMEWCSHLIWQYSNTAQKWKWFFKKSLHYSAAIADDWIVCPLCGTPRPLPRHSEAELDAMIETVKTGVAVKPKENIELPTPIVLTSPIIKKGTQYGVYLVANVLNQLIDHLKWKESHDKSL